MSNSDVHKRILADRAEFARFAIAKLALVLALWTVLIAAPLAAQNTLTASEANLRIYAYRISLENTQEREKLGLVAAELRTRAERAEARWRTSSRQLSAERERGELQQARISELEDQAASDKAEFAASITELTDTLAEKDRDFRAKLELALLDGSDYQETEAGRKALALFAEGGNDNISEGLDILDEVLALEDQVAAFERAARYRRAARTRLGVRGIHTATTDRIIQLYEEVVEYDPQSSPDWLELARLYRDARLVDKAIEAADNAVRFSNGDAERGYALFERAEVQYLRWVDDAALEPVRRYFSLMSDPTSLGLELALGTLTHGEIISLLIDATTLALAPPGDADVIKTFFLQSGELISEADQLDTTQRALFTGRAFSRAGEAQVFKLRASVADKASEKMRLIANESEDVAEFAQRLRSAELLSEQDQLAVQSDADEMRDLLLAGIAELDPLLLNVDPLVATSALDAMTGGIDRLFEALGSMSDETMLGAVDELRWNSNQLLDKYPDFLPAQRLRVRISALQARTYARMGRLEDARSIYELVSDQYDQLIVADPYSADLRVARLMAWIEERSAGLGQRDWATILEEEDKLANSGLLAPDDKARIIMSQSQAIRSGGFLEALRTEQEGSARRTGRP